MTEKTRQEFDEWANEQEFIIVARDRVIALKTWQHQQSIIDAGDAEIARLRQQVEFLSAQRSKAEAEIRQNGEVTFWTRKA